MCRFWQSVFSFHWGTSRIQVGGSGIHIRVFSFKKVMVSVCVFLLFHYNHKENICPGDGLINTINAT